MNAAARSSLACCKLFVRRSAPVGFSSSLPHPLSIHSLCDLGTCVSVLRACASVGDVSTGKKIHSWVVVSGFEASPFVVTGLINFYSKCGHPVTALAIFHRVSSPNIFQWNAAVAGMVANVLPEEALDLYREMERAGVVPDKYTYPCVIKACSDLKEGPLVARSIHGRLLKVDLQSDVFISSALINAYMKMDLISSAKKIFDKMSERDVVLWNSMVNGFAQMGQFQNAVELFQRMGKEGLVPCKFTLTGIVSVFAATGDLTGGRKIHGFVKKSGYESNTVVSNSLIDMYGKCHSVNEANQVFEAMPQRDILSWNSMISISEQSGDYHRALKLLNCMKGSGVLPDPVTVSAVLPACAHMAALFHGRMLHGFMIANGWRKHGDVFLDNVIMDMYAKCSCLDDARLVFDMMDARDAASWNIMIGGYSLLGDGVKAIDMFSYMCEASVAPNEVTFVNVLSGCSHSGLVDQGKQILERMRSEYNVAPTFEHYACVVDMLGRAGRLLEAYDLAINIPIGLSPVVWRAYLAACLIHGDTERLVDSAQQLLDLEPEHCGSYVLLSNAYGSTGRYSDVLDIRSEMRHQNVRKPPGCSWIELGSEMHVFVTGDRNHIDSDKICTQLHVLIGQLQEFGYVPDMR